MKKLSKVVMLPTEKANALISTKNFGDGKGLQIFNWVAENTKPQHLYIIADEPILPVRGDNNLLFIARDNSTGKDCVFCARAEEMRIHANENNFGRIIATTDPHYQLPRPSNEFIEAYCKAGGIDEVMVEYISYATPSKQKESLKVAPDNTITITITPVQSELLTLSREQFRMAMLDSFKAGRSSDNWFTPWFEQYSKAF